MSKGQDKKKEPVPPDFSEVGPDNLSDTKMCRLLFHTHALWAWRSGLDPRSIIAGLEAELFSWRKQFPEG